LKEKNVFEASGNSPTSESGAPILTGKGMENVRLKIMRAFEEIRIEGPVQSSVQGPAESPQAPEVYDGQHEARFHQRAKRLSLAALAWF
jgi:hypothetical protein